MDLFVPNLAGALAGTNPFLILPDACGYGVAAGLFQYAPKPPAQEMERALLSPEALAARAVQREEYRQRGKAERMGPLLLKKDAKASTAGSAVQQVGFGHVCRAAAGPGGTCRPVAGWSWGW